MTSLTLWQMPGSPPSWAVRIMAQMLNLKVDLKNIDFLNLEHKSPEFRKINPVGTIPVLKDGDFVIYESHSAIKYLLDKYGKEELKKLYPANREERALVDQVLFFDTGVAFIRVKNIALPVIYEGMDCISPKLVKETEDVYDIVELFLDGKDYVASKEFTLADISLGCTITSLNSLIPVDANKFSRTTAWLKRVHSHPGFPEIALAGTEILATVVKSTMEKNKTKK